MADPSESTAERRSVGDVLSQSVPQRVVRFLIVGVCSIALTIVAATAISPSGWGAASPGPVYQMTSHVSGSAVVDTGGDSPGWLAFTTVNIAEMSTINALAARLRGETLYKLTQDAQSSSALVLMETSKHLAASTALARTGQLSPSPAGAMVVNVRPGSPADISGVVAGDVIVAVDGVDTPDPSRLQEMIGQAESGAVLSIIRSGSSIEVLATPRSGKIGVEVASFFTASTKEQLNVDTQGVGGSSAGLMMTLAFIDALAPGSLTAGLAVAGTGTIEPTGDVGPVAGLPLKVAAAAAAGADVFMYPASLESQVQSNAASLELVPITTVEDALVFLCGRGATDSVCDSVDI